MRLWIEDNTQTPAKQEIELSQDDARVLRELREVNPDMAMCLVVRWVLHKGINEMR